MISLLNWKKMLSFAIGWTFFPKNVLVFLF